MSTSKPYGSEGGYTAHGSFIVPDAMMELVQLRRQRDAALESVKEYLESAIQHRIISGDLYMVGRNDAFRDAAGFIESRIGTNPLAEAQARIAALEQRLAEATKFIQDIADGGGFTGAAAKDFLESTHD